MKKLIAAVVFGISIFGLTGTALSQTKIGYINTEELIGAMPEAEKQQASYRIIKLPCNNKAMDTWQN